METRVSAAEAKAQLSELVSRVAYGHERVIIERRGKPLAALIGIEELERLEPPTPKHPDLFDLLKGAAGDLSDEEIDAMVADIYAERERSIPRPSPFEDRLP